MKRKKHEKVKRKDNRILIVFILIILLPFLTIAVQTATKFISKGQSFSCPTSSGQSYDSIRPDTAASRKIRSPEGNPEVNISLRGWTEINAEKQPIGYGGDTDPNSPPSIGSVFAGHLPQIVKTYIINDWDYANGKPIPGKSATPAYPVHLIGLSGAPGEPLLGLMAGRKIYQDFTLMVLFATPTSILFSHSTGDLAPPDDDGYPFYFIDLCVDPNLLALYQKDAADGRNVLPAIRAGQIFGYVKDTDVKVAVRDTGSFMDPRAKKDWWQFGPAEGTPYTPASQPTSSAAATNSPTAIIPTVNNQPAPTTYIPPTNIPPSQSTPIPISVSLPSPAGQSARIIYVTPTPIPQSNSYVPNTPAITPTPLPLVDLKKTVETAKSVWSNILISILQFTKVILP